MRPKTQQRRGSVNALDKDPPPPHNRPSTQAQSTTTLPITQTGRANKKPTSQNPTRVTRIPSQPASSHERRVTTFEERDVRRTAACARSDTASCTCTCTSTLPPNAHPLRLHPRFKAIVAPRSVAIRQPGRAPSRRRCRRCHRMAQQRLPGSLGGCEAYDRAVNGCLHQTKRCMTGE